MTHDAAPILDLAVLDELRASVDGDESFIADLVSTYVNEGNDHLAAMEAAVLHTRSGFRCTLWPLETIKSPET